MPKANRDAIEQEEEIFSYLQQSHISAKNTARLKQLAASLTFSGCRRISANLAHQSPVFMRVSGGFPLSQAHFL